MSNDLVSLQKSLALISGGVDDDTRALAGAGGGGSKRISIKGGVFRKFVGGKEVAALEDRHMHVIFAKIAHAPARTFYTQGYKEGEKVSPQCWSNDSKTPDAEVTKPQASTCDTCPRSIKGSGPNGTGTACRLQWRTAVVLPGEESGDIMQLVLPPTSIWGDEDNGKFPFKSYGRMLANLNGSMSKVVTKVQFDTKSPVPKLLFSPVAALTQEQYAAVQNAAISREAENAVKLTVFKSDEGDNGMFPPAPPEPDASPKFDADLAKHLEESESEPTLREAKPATPEVDSDISETIKKWSKKKV